MNKILIAKHITITIFKGILVSIIGLVGASAGGIITSILGLPGINLPESVDLQRIFLQNFFTGIFIAVLIGEMFKKLKIGFMARFIFIFIFYYLNNHFLLAIEASVFTNIMNLSFGALFGIFPSLLIALGISLFWPSSRLDKAILARFSEYFKRKKPGTFILRFIGAWLIFIVIYYLMGMIVSPIVVPYYQNPDNNLGLVLPPQSTIVKVQLLRGFLYLLSVLPIFILWNAGKKSLFLWLSSIFIYQNIAMGMLFTVWLPAKLRIAHSIELTLDSILLALFYVVLLYIPANRVKESKNDD